MRAGPVTLYFLWMELRSKMNLIVHFNLLDSQVNTEQNTFKRCYFWYLWKGWFWKVWQIK